MNKLDRTEIVTLSIISIIVGITLIFLGFIIYRNIKLDLGSEKVPLITIEQIASKFNEKYQESIMVKNGLSIRAERVDNKLVIKTASESADYSDTFEMVVKNNIIEGSISLFDSVEGYFDEEELQSLYEASYQKQYMTDVITIIGMYQGLDETAILATLKLADTKNFTIEKNHFEYKKSGSSLSVKMNLAKKMDVVKATNEMTYITLEQLSAEKLKTPSGQMGSSADNKISFAAAFYSKEVNLYDNNVAIIKIYEKDKLTSKTYQSIVNIITVMFDEQMAKSFQNAFKTLPTETKVSDIFDLEVNIDLRESEILYYGYNAIGTELYMEYK